METQNNYSHYVVLILLVISLLQFLYVNLQKNSQDLAIQDSKNRMKLTTDKMKNYLERLEKNVKSGKVKKVNEDFEGLNQQMTLFEKDFNHYIQEKQSQLQDVTLTLERYEEILNQEYKKAVQHFKTIGVIDDYEKKFKELKDQVNVSINYVIFRNMQKKLKN